MKIHVYAVCWNEQIRLPFFLRHYEKFADKIVIYDNMSDDGSKEIIEQHPLVEYRPYDTQGKIRDDIYLLIKNKAWQADKEADWLIVVDIDEFIHHKDPRKFLEQADKDNYSIIEPEGFRFYSEKAPCGEGHILEEVYMGKPAATKKCVFNRNKIQEINFMAGCHNAMPQGDVNLLKTSEMKFLHFHFIGKEFIDQRRESYKARLSDWNIKHGLGTQYLEGKKGNDKRFEVMKNNPEYKDMRSLL